MITDGERRYGHVLFDLCSEGVRTGKRERPPKTLPKGIQVRVKNKGSRAHKRGRKGPNYQAPGREPPQTSSGIENTPIHANHLEAFNAPLRRRCAAYRRKTNTYAKGSTCLTTPCSTSTFLLDEKGRLFFLYPQADLGVEQLEREVRRSVLRSVNAIRAATNRVTLFTAAVGFAQRNLEAEKARFALGQATNNEVVRVQQDLKEAQAQVVSATVDLLIGAANLDALTGALADHQGITFARNDSARGDKMAH